MPKGGAMNQTYRPLPQFAEPAAPETILERGARVLQFILATSCTATLTDLDLERADNAAAYAVAAPDPNLTAVAAISEVRHAIAQALKYRRSILPACEQYAPPNIAEMPNLGPMAKLEPAPRPMAPSGGRATPAIQF
jgi:hypothetical protein